VGEVRELRIRWIGHALRAEADIDVDPALSVGDAHRVAHHVERHLLAALPRLAGATIHVSPAGAHHPDRVGR
jgi:divalent metal cation (Fe/Co/Zn/Cd) transporter